MFTLAIDTTTRIGSCAVRADGALLRERTGESGGGHAERLPGELMAVLADAGVTLGQVDLFAVATGPGSFTGLRIGVATMQALAFASGKPLVGVSGFDALAHIAARQTTITRIATWVDAWRGEVYAALYEDGRELAAPAVATPEVLLRGMGSVPTLFIGDGAVTYRDRIEAELGRSARVADQPAPALAATIAALGEAAAAAGAHPSPHAIRPLYVRRTDAELAREARVRR
jgi:tRNA threonylcarbamoyladenosine biosynthesis protein TsaB